MIRWLLDLIGYEDTYRHEKPLGHHYTTDRTHDESKGQAAYRLSRTRTETGRRYQKPAKPKAAQVVGIETRRKAGR